MFPPKTNRTKRQIRKAKNQIQIDKEMIKATQLNKRTGDINERRIGYFPHFRKGGKYTEYIQSQR